VLCTQCVSSTLSTQRPAFRIGWYGWTGWVVAAALFTGSLFCGWIAPVTIIMGLAALLGLVGTFRAIGRICNA
jgi:hypothetical protein